MRESILRTLRGIFDSDYRLIDTKNQIYEGKQYPITSQEFFERAREFQIERGCSQKYAVDTISNMIQVRNIVNKERDDRNQKDIEKLYDILETYENDDFDVGFIVIRDLNTPT